MGKVVGCGWVGARAGGGEEAGRRAGGRGARHTHARGDARRLARIRACVEARQHAIFRRVAMARTALVLAAAAATATAAVVPTALAAEVRDPTPDPNNPFVIAARGRGDICPQTAEEEPFLRDDEMGWCVYFPTCLVRPCSGRDSVTLT